MGTWTIGNMDYLLQFQCVAPSFSTQPPFPYWFLAN